MTQSPDIAGLVAELRAYMPTLSAHGGSPFICITPNQRNAIVAALEAQPSPPSRGGEVDEDAVRAAYNLCDNFIDEHADGDVSQLDDGQWSEMLGLVLSSATHHHLRDGLVGEAHREHIAGLIATSFRGGKPIITSLERGKADRVIEYLTATLNKGK